MGDSLLRTRHIYTAYLAFTTEENTIFFFKLIDSLFACIQATVLLNALLT